LHAQLRSNAPFEVRNVGRVQENLVKGGLSSRAANGRQQRTRPVQGIDQNVRLNRALWLLADGMRQLKASRTA